VVWRPPCRCAGRRLRSLGILRAWARGALHNPCMPLHPAAHSPGLAVVLGGTGGIGAALTEGLEGQGHSVLAMGRRTAPAMDYDRPETVAEAATHVAQQIEATGLPMRRLIVATGVLHEGILQPERSWAH